MNRRKGSSDRRLQNLVVKEEKRAMMRRNLDEYRRMVADRRVTDVEIEEERRVKIRRQNDIEKLRDENPTLTIPLEP